MAAKKKAVVEEPVAVETPVEEIVTEEVKVEEPVKEPEKVMAKVFDCERLNFRKAQNTNCEIIDVLDSSSEIEIVSSKVDWTKVKVNGKTGYVMTKYIKAI